MYMSYCRFEGTLAELQTCLADVEEHVNGEAAYPVSDREIGKFRRIVTEFTSWLHDMALLDDEGYLDEDVLNEVCEAMSKAYQGDD